MSSIIIETSITFFVPATIHFSICPICLQNNLSRICLLDSSAILWDIDVDDKAQQISEPISQVVFKLKIVLDLFSILHAIHRTECKDAGSSDMIFQSIWKVIFYTAVHWIHLKIEWWKNEDKGSGNMILSKYLQSLTIALPQLQIAFKGDSWTWKDERSYTRSAFT